MDSLLKKLQVVLVKKRKESNQPIKKGDHIQINYPLLKGEEFVVWLVMGGARFGAGIGKTKTQALKKALSKVTEDEKMVTFPR